MAWWQIFRCMPSSHCRYLYQEGIHHLQYCQMVQLVLGIDMLLHFQYLWKFSFSVEIISLDYGRFSHQVFLSPPLFLQLMHMCSLVLVDILIMLLLLLFISYVIPKRHSSWFNEFDGFWESSVEWKSDLFPASGPLPFQKFHISKITHSVILSIFHFWWLYLYNRKPLDWPEFYILFWALVWW